MEAATVILKSEDGLFVTANFDRDPPVLYLTPDYNKAIEWNLRGTQICDKSCRAYWDAWDADEPLVTLHKQSKSFNQQWNIYQENGQVIIYSRNEDIAHRGVTYSRSSIFFDRNPRPFYPLVRGQDPARSLNQFASKSELKKGLTTTLVEGEAQLALVEAQKLYSVYNKGYAFPSWSIDKFVELYSDFCPKCRVYYSEGTLEDAKRLALEREPVNIAMQRYYDQDEMEALFGWAKGYYGRYFEATGKLAPNLAIYCPTLVVSGANLVRVHMINSIGYAFDSKLQPDYRVLGPSQPQSQARLLDRYRTIFDKIFRCAQDVGCSTVVMSMVGAGVFSELYPDFRERIWMPAFYKVSNRYPDIQVLFMGPSDLGMPNNIGLWPQNLLKVQKLLPTALFVNSWDPWSIAGNGNASDKSLDGFIGRSSMVALLTWPGTNLLLTSYTQIK